jgi:chromate reductase
MKQVLIVNGSPNGSTGNCGKLITKIEKLLKDLVNVRVIHLAKLKSNKSLVGELRKSDGVLFVTGTYWDSWGSPLQAMFEDLTEHEGTNIFLGKPCAVFVLMHSVGGKGILSRMQGVLSTLGFLIPPMTGMVFSLVSQLAKSDKNSKHRKDVWDLEDLNPILGNFILGLDIKIPWQSWPVDRENFRRVWLK